MPRCVNGMHLPNSRFWHIEQMLRAVGPTGAITCLHIQLVDDPAITSQADDENENWFGKLRFGFEPQGIPPAPERLIHIRVYHPHSLGLDPTTYGGYIHELLANWTGARTNAWRKANLWNDPFVCVSSANELNLHYENNDTNPGNQWKYETADHYQAIAEWDMAFWREVDRLAPDRKALRASPAFAFGHEPKPLEPGSEYTLPAVRAMLKASDIICAHPYALLHQQGGERTTPDGADAFYYMLNDFRRKGFKNSKDPGGLLAQVPDKPVLFSEAGTFTHSNKARTAETWKVMQRFMEECQKTGRVLGVTWFIWSTDSAHPENNVWVNDKLRGLLENAPRYVTTAEVPLRGKPTPPEEKPVPTFDTNPHKRAIYGPGAINQLAQTRQLVFISDEVTQGGSTGANVVQATLQDPRTEAKFLAVWSPGFERAYLSPLV